MDDIKQSKWAGKRYIALVRQSDDANGTASTASQLKILREECEGVGMHFVDQIVLEGVTGSLPGKREDLTALLKRKKERGDFDVIAVQLFDRLTRGGGRHGIWFEQEAICHGIEIFFVSDDVADGPYAIVVRAAKYEAAHEVSVGIGRRSTQGQTWAKQQGFYRTSGPTPMGCDRLYLDTADRPLFAIRSLPDGRQEQLDPQTRQVLGTFGTVGRKSRNRFKKQRNQYSLLVPGDREQVRIVRAIFYLRYKKGWRGMRIADFLNRHGVPSPRGKHWSARQVESIYENEAYTGFTYNNQTYSGRFFRADAQKGYEALDRSKHELSTAKGFRPVLRPTNEWQKVDQPHMHDFLPTRVQELAIAAQGQLWEHRLDPARQSKPANAHPASLYLLSGKLTAVQDGETLVGTLSGPPAHKTPYYRHKRGHRGRLKGSVFNNLIPARPLHAEMLKLLGEILLDTPNLRPLLTQILTEQRAHAQEADRSSADLEAERDELEHRIKVIVSTLTGAALEAASDELRRLGNRRNEIEAELKNRRSRRAEEQRPPEEVVDVAIRKLGRLAEQLQTLPPELLRQLIGELVTAARVDMATKAVELDLACPAWVLREPQMGQEGLCPPTSSRSQAGSWTQTPFLRIRCEYDHRHGSRRPACYHCRRRRAA